MNNLSNAERETILTMQADDRSKWHCFCDDPVMAARLDKLGAKRIREHMGGIEFELDAAQVLLRKGRKVMSEEVRLAMGQRLRASRTTDAKQANMARLEDGDGTLDD